MAKKEYREYISFPNSYIEGGKHIIETHIKVDPIIKIFYEPGQLYGSKYDDLDELKASLEKKYEKKSKDYYPYKGIYQCEFHLFYENIGSDFCPGIII